MRTVNESIRVMFAQISILIMFISIFVFGYIFTSIGLDNTLIVSFGLWAFIVAGIDLILFSITRKDINNAFARRT